MAETPVGSSVQFHSYCAQFCCPSLFLGSPNTPSVLVRTHWARWDASCAERFQDAGLGHTNDLGNFDRAES